MKHVQARMRRSKKAVCQEPEAEVSRSLRPKTPAEPAQAAETAPGCNRRRRNPLPGRPTPPAGSPRPPVTPERHPAPLGFWITFGIVAVGIVIFYAIFTFARLEIFKMLLGSFFPLAT